MNYHLLNWTWSYWESFTVPYTVTKPASPAKRKKIAKAQECASFTTEKEFARKPAYFCTVFNPTGFTVSLSTAGRMD